MNLQRAPAALPSGLDEEHIPDQQRRKLVLAQLISGGLAMFALIVYVASLPAYSIELHTICRVASCAPGQLTPATVHILHTLDISIDGYVLFCLINTIASAIFSFAVAGLIVWRRSNEWMALLVAFMLVMVGVSGTTNTVAQSASIWHTPTQILSLLSYSTYFLVFMVFPDGHFVPRWTRWLAVMFLALGAWYNFFPNFNVNGNVWFNLFSGLLFVSLVFSLPIVQIYRYWYISTSIQRQQTKWIILGLAVGLTLEFVPYLLTLFVPSLNQSDSLYLLLFNPDAGGTPVSLLVNLLLSLSFGIAILRYRLWDVDVLTNRALVYSILTVFLALLYLGLVLGATSLLHGIINKDSSIITVASTLVVVALFQPLRSRIQLLIDRHFYRSKYDATRAISRFNSILRTEVQLDQLTEQLAFFVQETMQPTSISLWLRQKEHLKRW